MSMPWNEFGISNGYAIFFIILALSLLARQVVKLLWNRILPYLIARTSTTLDDKLIARTAVPAANLALLVGLYQAMDQMARISDFELTKYNSWVLNGLLALTILNVALFLNGLIQAIADWYMEEIAHRTKTDLDKEFLPLFRRLASLVIFFITLTIILRRFDIDISALIATASVASLAVALAAQETLANMISGLTIMVDRPFRIGDRIEFPDGRIGEVSEIGLRSTRIRMFDNNILVVPNKEISATRVINYGYPNPKTRIRQVIGVAYGTDVAKAKEVILGVMTSHPMVVDDPAPGVFFEGFGDSSLNLAMVCFVDHYKDAYKTRDELNMAIDLAFREHGIEIPFPQRDVNLKGPAVAALLETRSRNAGSGDGKGSGEG
jgi:MscS family membrane protein